MATIPANRYAVEANFSNYVLREWTLANGDDGQPVLCTPVGDRTVQVSGTFGVGGSVQIQGSLDNINFFPLTDPQGNTLAFTSGKLETIMELAVYIRPVVTAGDGSTNLKVILCIKGVG